jgi:hypothetical protein
MNQHYFSLAELKAIPEKEYPFLVFSDNVRGLFSFLVKNRTKGSFGHAMWLVAPDFLASQWFYFRMFRLDHFAGCNLKLVHNPSWTGSEKALLKCAILDDLDKPWFKTTYDVPGVIGEFIGVPLQVPWLNFCSERGSYLKLVDPKYDLKSPTPQELNLWTKAHQDRYQVFGRFMPD